MNRNSIRITIVSLLLFCVTLIPRQLAAQENTPDADSAVAVMDTVIAGDEGNKTVQEDGVYESEKIRYFSNKDEYEQDVKPEFRQVSRNDVQEMKKDDAFWYADLKPKRKEDKPDTTSVKKTPERLHYREPLMQSDWFQTLLWFIIIGGFAVCVGIYLANNKVGFFRRRNVAIDTNDTLEETEDIFSISYDKQIEKARLAGNYRLAVRLHYLHMLKRMAEKNVIQYKQDRTNYDYLMQLHGSRFYEAYFRITRDYEYSWYGEFPVSEETYKLIRADFERMDQTLMKP